MMVIKLPLDDWRSAFAPTTSEKAMDDLESGQILLLESLGFALQEKEAYFLTPFCLQKGRKNISYDCHRKKIKGLNPAFPQSEAVI